MVSICIRTADGAYSGLSHQFSGNGLRILLVFAALLETPARFSFCSGQSDSNVFLSVCDARLYHETERPAFEALALVTLVKYGLWAVVMNFLVLAVTGDLPWRAIC